MNPKSMHELLFEMLNDGIVLHEVTNTPARGRFMEANGAACRLLGYTAEEMSALTPFDVVAPDESPLLSREATELQQRGALLHVKHLVAKDGRLIPVEMNSRVFEDEGRTLALSVIRDITERRRGEMELRESEERFRVMADSAPIILWVADAQGGNQFVNRTYREYFGVTLHGAEEDKWRPFLHPDDAPKYLGDFLRAVRERSPFKGEARVRRKDGEWRSVRTHGEPRYSATGEFLGHAGITLDITDQRQLEEQFQQSQKLESIGRLAGGIAHDFNNLLTVILSCAEALKEDVSAGIPAQLEMLGEIHAAGQRAAELTRQLLAFARKQVIAPVPLDLNAVVRGSEKLLRRVLGEDVELVTKLQPALWTVRCDQGQIEQVILNLAINSRDAMPGGGKLTIETTNAQLDESLVALHPFLRTGPHVRITVSDTGAGMTSEVKAHLFEPFFTTKPPGKGTGLGLAMIYGIVKQSGGYILVESEAGSGTSMELYLPRTFDAAVTATAVPTATRRGTETVLVVEDDPHVREVTLRSLRAGGYRVIAAASGREALEVAAGHEGALDLLLTDVILPGLNGRELAEELGRHRPDLRVLYMSGYTQDVISPAGVLDSGIEFLTKPFTAVQLQERVRKVLDAG